MWFVTLVFCPRSRASQKASKQSAESTGKQATISALKHLTNNPIRPPSPRRILAVYIIDMQYPRVVGAYPAAGQFLRADLATIILYSKERVGKYPAVIYNVLMFPPSFIIPISLDHRFPRCSPGETRPRFANRMQKVQAYMNSEEFAARDGAGLASLAESLRDRCRRLVLLKGERLRS